MEDIEDYYFEQIDEDDVGWSPFRINQILLRDAENYVYKYSVYRRRMDYWCNQQKSPLVTCKYCKEKNLKWKMVDGKWRLFKGKKIHNCKSYVAQH